MPQKAFISDLFYFIIRGQRNKTDPLANVLAS